MKKYKWKVNIGTDLIQNIYVQIPNETNLAKTGSTENNFFPHKPL